MTPWCYTLIKTDFGRRLPKHLEKKRYKVCFFFLLYYSPCFVWIILVQILLFISYCLHVVLQWTLEHLLQTHRNSLTSRFLEIPTGFWDETHIQCDKSPISSWHCQPMNCKFLWISRHWPLRMFLIISSHDFLVFVVHTAYSTSSHVSWLINISWYFILKMKFMTFSSFQEFIYDLYRKFI